LEYIYIYIYIIGRRIYIYNSLSELPCCNAGSRGSEKAGNVGGKRRTACRMRNIQGLIIADEKTFNEAHEMCKRNTNLLSHWHVINNY
jgi:hypothetical protein